MIWTFAKVLLGNHGVNQIHHWTGRKVGDYHKIIPHNTRFVVLVTGWISHSFMHKIKRSAESRGLMVIYTPNGSTQLQGRLNDLVMH